MALFSIVITTTRSELVSFAVHSVLAQDFKDFEIIVSDNSDEGCKDIIERFNDSRIKYVRPSRYLGIVDHWNFAFSHASGDWQIHLCDDHAFVSDLLTTLAKEIEKHTCVDTVVWPPAFYMDGEWWIESERFQFVVPPFSGIREVFSSKDIIAEMFDSGTGLAGVVKRKVPLSTRTVYSKRIIKCICDRFGGHLFEPICPMTSAALAALALSEKTVRIDLPLIVHGTSKKSAAGHFADASTFEKMNRGNKWKYVPIRSMAVFPAGSAETILHVQNLMPEELRHLKLNWVNFFVACNTAIEELQFRGRDCTYEVALYKEALSKIPDEIREQVSDKIKHSSSIIGKGVRKLKQITGRIIRTVGNGHTFPGETVDTRQKGLNDILECTRYLARLIKKYDS